MSNERSLPACPFCGKAPATTDDGDTVWCSAGTLPNGDLCPIEGVEMPAEAWRAICALKDRDEKSKPA